MKLLIIAPIIALVALSGCASDEATVSTVTTEETTVRRPAVGTSTTTTETVRSY